jgi:hypothetical protein
VHTRIYALLKNILDGLRRRRDDAASTDGTDYEEWLAGGGLHDGWGGGGEGTLIRPDVAVGVGKVTEEIGAARCAEVVHLVVHDDAILGRG